MKKLLILPMLIAVCAADFGAFAAPRGRTGGTSAGSAPAAAPKANGARAAATKKVTNAGAKTSGAPAPAAQKANGARAAATQKALKMGTKVSAAVENTAVSSECQNAYYGCMDAFCMLDNAAGGRCQCNDKITELDNVLAEIMKIEDNILKLKTEGVAQVEMGEYADEVAARTKNISNEYATNGESKMVSLDSSSSSSTVKKRSRVLDLSTVKSSSMFDDDDDDDVFSGLDQKEPEITIADDLANKKGDELHKAAAKICTQQIPTECKASASMLQMTYAQKVRSDCTGYANALTQRKQEASTNLLAAQQELREAVLDSVKEANKYGTEGECVTAFDKCMQTDGGCGSDYTQCVADDTVLTMGTDGKKGQATTASVATAASSIGISANTLAIITEKSKICEKVLKQCQNVRSGVWNTFLKMIVPTLKSAEVNAEQNRRTNCIGEIVKCYTDACAAKWPDQESAEYDMCLSNPDIVSNLCQIQINRCSTGSTGEQVMEYVKAKLQALRVDACTNEVKACLESENNCGQGYVNCIGLDKDTIVKMCTNSATNYKLMACQSKFSNNQYEVQNYVAQVAQGLILNMDNAALKQCEEAGKKAMTAFCGSDTKCEGEKVEKALTFSAADEFGKDLTYIYCPTNPRTGEVQYGTVRNGKLTSSNCFLSPDSLVYNDLKTKTWETVLAGKVNFGCFQFSDGSIDVNAAAVIDLAEQAGLDDESKKALENNQKRAQLRLTEQTKPAFTPEYSASCMWGQRGLINYADADRIADLMTQRVISILGRIETDTTVKQCVLGRDIKGITTYKNVSSDDASAKDSIQAFDDVWSMKVTSGTGKGVFPNLMIQYRKIIAEAVLRNAEEEYKSYYDNFVATKFANADKKLTDRIDVLKQQYADLMDYQNDLKREQQCKRLALGNWSISAMGYNRNSNYSQSWYSNAYANTMYLSLNEMKTLKQYWTWAGFSGTPSDKDIMTRYRMDVAAKYNKDDNSCTLTIDRFECDSWYANEGRNGRCYGKYTKNGQTKTKKLNETDYMDWKTLYQFEDKANSVRYYN